MLGARNPSYDSVRLPCVSAQRVVALLGVGLVPSDTPILRADDLGVLRGDGIFETIHVRGGEAWQIEPHLDRMARSAQRMAIELPDRGELAALVELAVGAWPAGTEGALRLICTRGLEEGAGTASVFATVSAVSAANQKARHTGVNVLTASLGFPAGLRDAAPWLLGGAKTLSYAVNMASQRWAQTNGADDVLWVSADGFALEGPTSTLVWREGDTLFTVPVAGTGILAGTTAAYLLDRADELGWRTGERMVTPAELADSDGVWFTSSVRGIAAIRSIDGTPVPFEDGDTQRIRDLLGFP